MGIMGEQGFPSIELMAPMIDLHMKIRKMMNSAGVTGERALEGNLEKALAGMTELVWRQPDLGVAGVTAASALRRTKIHCDSEARLPN